MSCALSCWPYRLRLVVPVSFAMDYFFNCIKKKLKNKNTKAL
jgi:hypothetical protein